MNIEDQGITGIFVDRFYKTMAYINTLREKAEADIPDPTQRRLSLKQLMQGDSNYERYAIGMEERKEGFSAKESAKIAGQQAAPLEKRLEANEGGYAAKIAQDRESESCCAIS
jgi:hypothetical protein